MGLSKPVEHGDVTITGVTVNEDSTTMNFEGTVGKYGSVFVTQTLHALDGDKSRGRLEGNARVILDDGTLLWSPVTGTFRSKRSTATIFFLDCVSKGDQNFVIWDVDMLGKTARVRVYSLL